MSDEIVTTGGREIRVCTRSATVGGVFDELVHALNRIPARFDHRRLAEACALRTGRFVPHVDGDDLRIASPCGGELVLRCTPGGRCDEILAATSDHAHLTDSVALTYDDARSALLVEGADTPLDSVPVLEETDDPALWWWRRTEDPHTPGRPLRMAVDLQRTFREH